MICWNSVDEKVSSIYRVLRGRVLPNKQKSLGRTHAQVKNQLTHRVVNPLSLEVGKQRKDV